jgi:Mg2+/Co2+ transporter CorB
MLVTASQEAGVLEEQEEQMLHRVFGFADLTAGQVMVPRTELVAIPADMAMTEVAAKISSIRETRVPVYSSDLDNVIGMLHVIDVLRALSAGEAGATADTIAREVLTVPVTLGADDLLSEMRRRRVREATGDRRVRRHRRPGDVRVADGQGLSAMCPAPVRPPRESPFAPTDPRTSTGSHSSPM